MQVAFHRMFLADRAIRAFIASTMITAISQKRSPMPQANTPESTLLAIKVILNASRNQIASRENDTLKIRIQSPPIDGKANKAFIAFLSKQTQLSKSRITLQSGETGRQKWIAFSGIDRTDLLDRLGTQENPHGKREEQE